MSTQGHTIEEAQAGTYPVPAELCAAPRWVAWRTVEGKKPPVRADGAPLKDWKAQPLTWEQAQARAEAVEGGVGFLLGEGIGGLDLDNCRDPKTGDLDQRAQAVLDQCPGAYAEVSPSGLGVKVFGRCEGWLELTFRRKPDRVDVSRKSKGYFTVTGEALEGRTELPELDLHTLEVVFGDAREAKASEGAALPDVVLPGRQNEALHKLCCALRRLGFDEADMLASLNSIAPKRCPDAPGQKPWTESDYRAIARSAARHPKGEQAEQAAAPLQFLTAAQVIAEPPVPATVAGVAWQGRVTTLVAESGCGKTFVLLDLASSVATGESWCGKSVEHGSVAFLSFEGDALSTRLRAIEERHERDLEHVHVLHATEPISPGIDHRDRTERSSMGEARVSEALDSLSAQLEADGKPPVRLVIIDTVRASLAGSEDASDNVSAYLRAVRRITRRVPQAATILSHHSGWQDGDTKRSRERGSSAFRGNVDATLLLKRGRQPSPGLTYLDLRALKVRDGALWDDTLQLRTVDVGLPVTNGRQVTSCIVQPADRSEVQKVETEAREAERQRLVVRVLRAMLDSGATNKRALRESVGLKSDTVDDIVAELQARKLARPRPRGAVYEVQAAGRAMLDAGQGNVDDL